MEIILFSCLKLNKNGMGSENLSVVNNLVFQIN